MHTRKMKKYTTFQTSDGDIIKWLKSILPDMTEDIIITDREYDEDKEYTNEELSGDTPY